MSNKKNVYFKFVDGTVGMQTVDADDEGNFPSVVLPTGQAISKELYDETVQKLADANAQSMVDAQEATKAEMSGKREAALKKYPELEGLI